MSTLDERHRNGPPLSRPSGNLGGSVPVVGVVLRGGSSGLVEGSGVECSSGTPTPQFVYVKPPVPLGLLVG